MGIPGAKSLMDEDPRRFGDPWRCNWPKDADGSDNGDGEASAKTTGEAAAVAAKKTGGTSGNELMDEAYIVLVDGMSLLYHLTVNSQARPWSTMSIHSCPFTIRKQVASYISNILKALPEYSELRIFMDGLAPTCKITTQLQRLRSQAIHGDNAARKEQQAAADNNFNGGSSSIKSPAKILDPLAEWAFVEAIEEVSAGLKIAESSKYLELHRPSRGEAETYIDWWIGHKIPIGITNVFVLGDDSDFLVYKNCPGYIPLSTLEVREEKDTGTVRLAGFQYKRQKFLDAFLPSLGDIKSDDVMPVVSALAGCDYVLHDEAQEVLAVARNRIAKSDIGGLREKSRNNPSRALQLKAILRYVAHFVQKGGEHWADALCASATLNFKAKGHKKPYPNIKGDEAILKEAFLLTRKAYFRTLTIPNNPAFEKKPTSMEIRRLLEYGIFYCRPIIETWQPLCFRGANRKRNIEIMQNAMDTSTFALVIAPPFTRQVAAWLTQDSVWRMPHFFQARMRLHCLLVQFASTGGAYAFEGGQLRLSPMWTNEDPQVTEYVRSNSNGGKDYNEKSTLRILEKTLVTPVYSNVSAGWLDEADLLAGDDAVDRGCLFCILGNIRQASPALNTRLKNTGTVFLTSLFLPFNLAFLVILMGTSPDLEKMDLRTINQRVVSEVDKVWPYISMSCYHGMLIGNTLLSLFGTHSEEHRRSNLTSPGKIGHSKGINRVSDTIRYDDAVWIWSIIRVGADLEKLRSTDSDDLEEVHFAMDYLDTAMTKLRARLPQTDEWTVKMRNWRSRTKVLWVIWWEVFNVALTTEASVARMDAW